MPLRKIYQIKKPGNLEKLLLREENLPLPGINEVTVAVSAIGLNYADIFTVMGLYKAAPRENIVPGLEFAGIITDIGAGVTSYKIGDRVMGVTRFGAYATHLNIHSEYILPIPDSWSFQQAAAFPVQILTAYYALVPLGNLQKGQTVLIHSAAGGVGLLANRIAKNHNAFTIGVVGSAAKTALLKKEGFDAYLIRDKNFKENLSEILGNRELNIVLETTGGRYMKWSYELLAAQGRMVCYGSATFTPSGSSPNLLRLIWKFLFRPKFDPLSMITENKSIMAFNLIWLYEKSALMHQLMEEIFRLNLQPPFVGHVFKFNQVGEALEFFKTGKSTGKIIVEVDS